MRNLLVGVVAGAVFAASASAATFVVPEDRPFLQAADAIVIARPTSSYTQITERGMVETVTLLQVEETIKGSSPEVVLSVREPGGVSGDVTTVIPGSPGFDRDSRYLLFLARTGGGWSVRDLVLGQFAFRKDSDGRDILTRDADEIHGWNSDGTPHVERARDAAKFLAFVRAESRGRNGDPDYFVPPGSPYRMTGDADRFTATRPAGQLPVFASATYSATSYTYVLSGSMGGRWNVFPSAVNFYSVGTESGAPNNGITAIQAALAAWNNDPNSNVNLVYAGADATGTHTGGVDNSDGQNSIAFEQDLSAHGVSPFQCTANSYSGTLGLGGITSASGTHVGPNGETFVTAHEGDVAMNKGIAGCSLLFNNGDFNSAVTHEVGHALGFRHSDQGRTQGSACTADLECSNSAIMKSFVAQGLNAALQPYDQHAVAAVYPGSGGGTAPAAPTGVNARATTSTQVVITWTAVSGATSYQVQRRAAGGSFATIATVTGTTYTDTTASTNTAYLYRVLAVGSGGTSGASNVDLATTVIFTDDPLIAGSTVIKAVHLAELRTAVNAVRALAGLSAATFTDAATRGVVVKAVHINELRSALDAAMSALGLPSGGWTDTIAARTVIRAVHFQEIRNRVK